MWLQIELARLEMKDKSFPRAVEVLEGALDLAKTKFGEETAEACEYRLAGSCTACTGSFEDGYCSESMTAGGWLCRHTSRVTQC